LVATLNNLESLLHDASTLSSQHKITEARQRLNDADRAAQSALTLVDDVEAGNNALADMLGVFASPNQQTKLYYDRLQNSVHQVRQLINELNRVRESLTEDPQAVIITSFYYPTRLEVSAPEIAHPGLPITVYGQVSSNGDTLERTVRVLFDDTQLAEEMIKGRFSLQVTLPAQIPTGKHSLTVLVVPEEYYIEASTTMPIDVSRIPIQAEIQVPQTTILPKSVQISGRINHDLSPLADARVELNFKGRSSVVKTAADGSFTTSIEAPFDLSLFCPQELKIAIEPAEPWYAPHEAKRWILTINPLSSGLTLVAIISLGLILFSRLRITSLRPRVVTGVIVKSSPPKPLSIIPVPSHKTAFADTKGGISSAYFTTLGTIERVTGISMMPHNTLREYLNTTGTRLSKIIEPFTELTTIAENTFYSAHEPDENTVLRAERLVKIIERELPGGTA